MSDERSKERRKHYKDVEILIDQGFLHHTLSVFNTSFVLRSFFPEEVREISLQSFGGGQNAYRAWAVTKSLYSIKGFVFRGWEQEQKLFELVQTFPKRMIVRLYYEVLGLMSRYQAALGVTQAYAYEDYSRAVWRTNQGIPSNLFERTNGVQNLWQYFNVLEDRSEQRQADWGNAKFIASAMSPKGVQKQQKKDEAHQRKVKDQKEEFIEDSIKRAEGFFMDGGDLKSKPIFINAKTDEDMMDEYHRWVAGDKDPHDLIVDQYKERIRNAMNQREEKIEARRQSLIQDGGSRGIFAATSVVGDQFDLSNFKRGTRRLQDISPQKRLYNRFLGKEEVGGEFYVDDSGQIRRKG